MHQGHQSLVRRSVEDNDITAMYWGGAPADLSSWQPNSTFAYERDAGHDWPLAEEAGCDILFAPPADVLFPRAPATTVTLPSFSKGFASARGPGPPRPDRAGDVQALEHVRPVPQLLRGEGLAAAGDVRASRRGPRVPGRGARLPDRPRRRRRRGVEPQLAAHARAARDCARPLPGPAREPRRRARRHHHRGQGRAGVHRRGRRRRRRSSTSRWSTVRP